MKEYKNAELVEVTYENNGKKAILLFTGDDGIMTVKINSQSYDEDSKKWVDDPERDQKANDLTQSVFGCFLFELENCVGNTYTVYSYETKDDSIGYSLTKPSDFARFDEEMCGQIYQTKVDAVVVDEHGIHVQYKIDGKIYRTNHSFEQYVNRMQKYFPDENKKRRSLKTFLDRYGVPVEEAQTIVGHDLMVEVKRVGNGQVYYGETKAFPKKKK